jgi:biotin carboxylase
VNPFDDASIAALDLSYPFWLKPVVAFSSHLAFRVRNAAELRWAIKAIRAGIGKFAEPYDDILRLGGLGHLPAELGGYMCVAEAAIGGRQCTVEGYVQDGRVQPYAIIDSIRARNRTSFLRYEYPSSLPTGVRARLRDLTVRLVEHIGLDDTTFNVEFFWERSWDSLHLLEINARMSKSHCPLFTLTCGSSHHEVAIDVALGRPVDYPHAHSGYSHAAKFMPRVFHDARVARVPSAAQIKEVGRRFPGTEVHVHVRPGMRLSDLPNQDSYSYEIADVFLGADSRRDLLARYREVMKILDFRFAGLNEAPVEAVASARG